MAAFLLPAIGIAASLAGSLMGKGKKPEFPSYVPPDVDAEQSKAITGNIANLGRATKLGEGVNQANQSELTRMLEKAIPGYSNMVKQSLGTVESWSKGEIPQDVADQIQRNTAEKSLAGGFAGSQAGRNLTARDLGLTSLELTSKGLDASARWLSTLKNLAVPGQFDITSMFLTPAKRVDAAIGAAGGQYESGVLQAKAAAMPDPTTAAFGNFLSQAGGLAFGYGMQKAGGGGVKTGNPYDPGGEMRI